jgi:nucleotide-binding universal stress UspA family protein
LPAGYGLLLGISDQEKQMIKRILVPLDGSELSEMAILYAQELAIKNRSQITLFLVCSREEEKRRNVFEAFLQSTAERLVKTVQEKTSNKINLEVDTVITIGSAALEIENYAINNGIGLIVITSHGRSGLLPWAMGSTASRVAQDLRVPVLLVRSGDKSKTTQEDSLFSKILVPLDGSEAGESAVPYVLELASQIEMQVLLLQVLSPEPQVHTIGGLDHISLPQGVLEMMRSESEQYLQSVQNKFQKTNATVKFEVRSGNPAFEIIKMTNENDGWLLAMSSHGHSGVEKWMLGSVTDKIIHGAKSPVLLVRAKSVKS